jgi:hypothetical protein
MFLSHRAKNRQASQRKTITCPPKAPVQRRSGHFAVNKNMVVDIY